MTTGFVAHHAAAYHADHTRQAAEAAALLDAQDGTTARRVEGEVLRADDPADRRLWCQIYDATRAALGRESTP